MNADNKVERMVKVWNAPWAMKEHCNRLPYLMVVLLLICTIGRIAPAQPKDRVFFLNLVQASLRRSDEKIIEREPYPDEPVEIDNLAVKNVKIALHQKFSAKSVAEQGGGSEEDWLENLEFAIKNPLCQRD